MTPAEIIAQVRPCDMEKPYIFISYSAMDHPLVWEDVLMFQKLGYNVWLDERNLDKKKDSWKLDALNAISDPDCTLVVFYVSRSSLTSQNCLAELEQTISQEAILFHLDPVPFIAVDAEEIGNIGDFVKKVRSDVMRQPLSKDEKKARISVLGKFTIQFFDSNNERVRVHPKNEPNRKLNYYEEIIASFPESAKTYPPEIEAPWVVEARKRKAAEEEAKRKAEEDAKRKAAEDEAQRREEEEARRKAEQEAKQKAEEEARRKKQDGSAGTALADQVSKLLSRHHDLLGWELEEETPAGEPAKEEKTEEKSESGLSLEELIRRRLDAGKKK